MQQIIETNGKTNGFVVLYSSIGNFKWLKSINTNGSLLSNLKHVHNTSTTNNWTMVSGNFLGQITFVNSPFPTLQLPLVQLLIINLKRIHFLQWLIHRPFSTITPLLDTDSMTIETFDLKKLMRLFWLLLDWGWDHGRHSRFWNTEVWLVSTRIRNHFAYHHRDFQNYSKRCGLGCQRQRLHYGLL